MKLSEAMRKGSVGTTQIYGSYGRADGKCALGMAWSGAGGLFSGDVPKTGDDMHVSSGFCRMFPVLVKQASCPACPKHLSDAAHSALGIIIHLNDGHKMTIEQIIQWVETVLEAPAEIAERKSGFPPPVPASEIWKFVHDSYSAKTFNEMGLIQYCGAAYSPFVFGELELVKK